MLVTFWKKREEVHIPIWFKELILCRIFKRRHGTFPHVLCSSGWISKDSTFE
jgi:hypothetical protein